MKTLKLKLAGREYDVELLRAKASEEWRGKLKDKLGEFGIADVMGAAALDITNGGGVSRVIDGVMAMVVQAPRAALDLIALYAPQIEADKDAIFEEAYDVDIIAAFSEVVKTAIPLDSMRQLLSGLTAPKTTKK